MLMSRRTPLSWRATLRTSLWPRRSRMRSWRYLQLRLRRISVLPRSLALGAAAGVFVAVLPIPGVQLLAAAGLAWLIRGHRGTAALATFAANPVTYPLIWVASYALGATILGTPVSEATHDLDVITHMMSHGWSRTDTMQTVLPAMKTLTVGAIPLAALSAAVAYYGVRRLLRRKARPPANGSLTASAPSQQAPVAMSPEGATGGVDKIAA